MGGQVVVFLPKLRPSLSQAPLAYLRHPLLEKTMEEDERGQEVSKTSYYQGDRVQAVPTAHRTCDPPRSTGLWTQPSPLL